MTREGVGMGEGFGAERIAGSAKRKYSLRLILAEEAKLGQQNVRPAAEAELLTVELMESEVWGFVQEAAQWAQGGLKARAAIEKPNP